MKKLALVLAVLLFCVLLLSACTPAAGKENTPTQGATVLLQGTRTTSDKTNATTVKPPVQDTPLYSEEAMKHAYRWEFSIESAVYSLVEKEQFDAWFSTFKQWNENGTREAYEMNMYTLITEFAIPRSEIERICTEHTNQFGDEYLTDEQVNAIYTATEEEVYRLFANPFAVMVGKRAYPPQWLVDRTAKDYLEAGITYDILTAEFDDLLIPCTEEQRTHLRTQLAALKNLDT